MVKTSPSSYCSAAMDEFIFYLWGFQLTVGALGPVLHVAALRRQLQLLVRVRRFISLHLSALAREMVNNEAWLR